MDPRTSGQGISCWFCSLAKRRKPLQVFHTYPITIGADLSSPFNQELDLVTQSLAEQYGQKSDAERKADFRAQLRERQNAERARHGMPHRPDNPPSQTPLKPPSSQLVEILERNQWQDDWGFVLFRTDYTDEARWERFAEEFNRIIDASIEEMVDERSKEGVMVKMVVDENLQGASYGEIAQWADLQHHQVVIGAWDLKQRCARLYASVKEAGEVPPGLDLPMCLVVDADTIVSVVENHEQPYIVAASTRYHSSQAQGNEDGHFKVALKLLLPDLYPLLASGGFDWQDLKPFAKPIFTNAYELLWGAWRDRVVARRLPITLSL